MLPLVAAVWSCGFDGARGARDSVAAQRELPILYNGRTAFAGAWQGWGYHEDGCASGVRAAESLGSTW